MDRILIRDLEVACIIGTMPKERVAPQTVVIGLSLACDLSAAGASDRIADTVDYRGVRDRVVALVERSDCFLIERLADRVAAACLEDPRVREVTVTLDKPGALARARSVAVEVTRGR